MGPYSKSYFTQSSNLARSMTNPISNFSSSNNNLTVDTINTLNIIEKNYTSNMSSKLYASIPNNYETLLNLYNVIMTANNKYSNNEALNILFKIAGEGLIGSMNAYGLNTSNMEVTIQNNILQKTIDDMLSGKNKKTAYSNSSGNLSIKKSFTLAPLFSYYIAIYGMPERGVGFDQSKIAMLLAVLEKNGIDPYK